MKMGIIISTNDPETIWSAFRFVNVSLQAKHKVKVFLINKGVEIDEVVRTKKYNIQEQIDSFIQANGNIFACGTCLKSRQKEGSTICPLSTLKDLLKIVEESDKVLTLG